MVRFLKSKLGFHVHINSKALILTCIITPYDYGKFPKKSKYFKSRSNRLQTCADYITGTVTNSNTCYSMYARLLKSLSDHIMEVFFKTLPASRRMPLHNIEWSTFMLVACLSSLNLVSFEIFIVLWHKFSRNEIGPSYSNQKLGHNSWLEELCHTTMDFFEQVGMLRSFRARAVLSRAVQHQRMKLEFMLVARSSSASSLS